MTDKFIGLMACAAVFACGGPSKQTRMIITGFAQGDAGNCSSIGFIKAVLHEYGKPEGILEGFERTPDGGLRARTRSGVAILLSSDEVRRGAEGSKLELLKDDEQSKALRDSASLLFAVMGKACEMDCAAGGSYCPFGKDRACTFDNAIEYLDQSLNWRIPPDLLGLKQGADWQVIKGWKVGAWFRVTRFVASARSCVAATGKHTFFVGEGWADKYGHPVSFNSKFGSWFAFKSASAYCLGSKQAIVEMKERTPSGSPPPEALNDPELIEIE